MDFETFDFDLTGGVATITLDRPESLNSLTFEIYRELTDAFPALSTADEVRSIVLTGAGRAFCSGGSFHEIISELLKRDQKEKYLFTRMTCDLIENMRACRKPIVAAVNGPAVGAGSLIALAADVRIMADDTFIQFVFVKIGLAGTDMGATYLLPRVVGLGMASELLMTGRRVPADEALRIGLANRLAPRERVLEEAAALAKELAHGPIHAIGLTKDLLNRAMGMDLGAALEMEAQTQALCMESPEFKEGYDAFVAKRPPVFHVPPGGPGGAEGPEGAGAPGE